MNRFRVLKYCASFTVPVVIWISLALGGWWSYFASLFAFGLIPLLEIILPENSKNLQDAEEEVVKKDKAYDYLLYLTYPIQYATLVFFLYRISFTQIAFYERIGMIITFGISCGILGINAAHELGHRSGRWEKWMAKQLLLSTQYMHFFIEHNRGHHKNVSTDADPASAKYGEWLYVFWARSIFFSYLDAWKLEADRMRKMGKKVFHPENEMLQFLFFQLTLNACILLITGWKGLLSYLLAAFVGILLLETVNYIEHYGLRRKKQGEDYYEKVMPHHSWNSDHVLGRLMLFELTRHSDHHYMASRKFQVLRHFENSPQMPAGYPAMMVLAFVPPLWFYVMHRHIRKLQLA